MEKELVELFEAAKKAADAASSAGSIAGGPEESRCLDALKQLKNFPVSYHVLVSTQVGKKLRHLTKHPKKKIQAFAADLIDIWKNVIIEETTRAKKNGNSDTDNNSIKVNHVNGKTSQTLKVQNGTYMKAEKPESAKGENVMQKSERVTKIETVKVEKMTGNTFSKTEKTEIVKTESKFSEEKQVSDTKNPSNNHVSPPKLSSMLKCGDATRDKVRELLSEALAKVYNEVYEGMKEEVGACDPIRIAVSVESVLFQNWGRTNGAQKSKYRSVMFNLKDPNNPDFRRKVLLGQVRPEILLTMPVEEMASDQRQFENAKIKEKALFECERGQAAVASTTEFRCGRCGKRECTYYQMQIRSADEPMTTFVTCVVCNNRWKFC